MPTMHRGTGPKRGVRSGQPARYGVPPDVGSQGQHLVQNRAVVQVMLIGREGRGRLLAAEEGDRTLPTVEQMVATAEDDRRAVLAEAAMLADRVVRRRGVCPACCPPALTFPAA